MKTNYDLLSNTDFFKKSNFTVINFTIKPVPKGGERLIETAHLKFYRENIFDYITNILNNKEDYYARVIYKNTIDNFNPNYNFSDPIKEEEHYDLAMQRIKER